ncbi:c-type cytochrome [Palleronia sp.]|uniref:c-type cytochrome n=1 Tax=Palleronia sp. TaxID=1940284 RepID=UPI0035C7A597
MGRRTTDLTMMLTSLALAACNPSPKWSVLTRGAILFQQTCASCHGRTAEAAARRT